jgi:hypothetical protein
MDVVPWPIAYGIGGGSLVFLGLFLQWFVRQLARGYDPDGKKHGLVPGSAVAQIVATERKRADDLLAEKDKTIESERTGRREAVEALKVSLESNKIVDDFFTKSRAVAR